jgi:AcrR family transcriptional regulator
MSVERTRQYRMGKRREEVEETRRRIVEATVELHGTVGPAATTISAIAELAGVQRSTVYRHFEDEQALFAACTSHWSARHPWPRADAWRAEPDPHRRLEKGLGELYEYYDSNRGMLGNSYRDIDVMPPFVGEMMNANVAELQSALVEPWEISEPWRTMAIAHAVDFRTFQTLDERGMSPSEAASLVTAMVSGLATERLGTSG